MIRLILLFIFLVFVYLFSLIALPIEWIIGKFNKRAKDVSSLKIVQGIFHVVLFICGTKTTVIGLENIPKDEAVLFVGNHHGFFDIIVSYVHMKPPTGYVAKKEMNRVPIIRKWMKNLYCLFLDRNDMKAGLKTILTGIDYLKNGTSIVIFPEGTRNEGDGVLPFHAGSFKLAEKSGCKIIPMAQCNTAAVFENQKPRIRKAHTILEFGAPIDINAMSKEERKTLNEYVRLTIEKMYEKNLKLV